MRRAEQGRGVPSPGESYESKSALTSMGVDTAHLFQGEKKSFISTATWRRKSIITLSRQQEKKKKNKNVSRRLGIDFKIRADKKMI